MATAALAGPATARARPPRRTGRGIRSNENVAGWLFVAPVIVILGLFLLLPILMALWVSFTELERAGQPVHRRACRSSARDNYTRLFTEDGLARATS